MGHKIKRIESWTAIGFDALNKGEFFLTAQEHFDTDECVRDRNSRHAHLYIGADDYWDYSARKVYFLSDVSSAIYRAVPATEEISIRLSDELANEILHVLERGYSAVETPSPEFRQFVAGLKKEINHDQILF